jgi:biotin operon repressor
MSRQFIRLPGELGKHIPNLDGNALKILVYMFSKSYYNGEYSPFDYSPQILCEQLNISKVSIIKHVNNLTQKGFIVKNGKEVKLNEYYSGAQEKSSLNELPQQKVQKMNFTEQKSSKIEPASSKIKPQSKEIVPKKLNNCTSCPLHDRLTKGFADSLVFFKYLYSNNSSFLLLDFQKVILESSQ